jgi:hypothetical protein
VRSIPIFDTNIFGHVQTGKIPESDWRKVMRHRPGVGWPLSLVTVLELLVDLDNVTEENFTEFRERIDIAFRLANGRILEDPKFLICKDLLRIPAPPHLIPPSAAVLQMYMSVIRHARSRDELLTGTVKAKRNRPSGLRGTDAPKVLVEDVKNQWISRVENTATILYPEWRACFERTRRRLPDEMRKALKQERDLEAEATEFTGEFLDWVGVGRKPEIIAELKPRLDAVVRFTTFVVGEFLRSNYSLEKHASDIFDQFQLHYLAMDEFTLVTRDHDLQHRTAGSPQASRIMSFETFLRNLCS